MEKFLRKINDKQEEFFFVRGLLFSNYFVDNYF